MVRAEERRHPPKQEARGGAYGGRDVPVKVSWRLLESTRQGLASQPIKSSSSRTVSRLTIVTTDRPRSPTSGTTPAIQLNAQLLARIRAAEGRRRWSTAFHQFSVGSGTPLASTMPSMLHSVRVGCQGEWFGRCDTLRVPYADERSATKAMAGSPATARLHRRHRSRPDRPTRQPSPAIAFLESDRPAYLPGTTASDGEHSCVYTTWRDRNATPAAVSPGAADYWFAPAER